MPKDRCEPEDPLELLGVAFPGGSAEEAVRCMVEEYVRLGFTDHQLLSLFRNPFFAGTHALYRAKGETWVQQVLAQVREQWGQPRFTVRRVSDGETHNTG